MKEPDQLPKFSWNVKRLRRPHVPEKYRDKFFPDVHPKFRDMPPSERSVALAGRSVALADADPKTGNPKTGTTIPIPGPYFRAFTSIAQPDGSYDLWGHIDLNPMGTQQVIDVYYRVYYLDIATNLWFWWDDVPWEQWWWGMNIKIGRRLANRPPVPFRSPQRLVSKVKIETHDLTDDIAENISTVIIDTPTDLTTFHEGAYEWYPLSLGILGAKYGATHLWFSDRSRWVASGRVVVTKFGKTSPGLGVKLYDWSFSGYPHYGGDPRAAAQNFIYIPYYLLPPGVPLAEVTATSPILKGIAIEKFVMEGDLIVVDYTTKTDDPASLPITSQISFQYYHTANFFQVFDVASIGQPYDKQLEIIQDPWNATPPITARFWTWPQAFPPGPASGPGMWKLTEAGRLTCNAPTKAGAYQIPIIIFNKSNKYGKLPDGSNNYYSHYAWEPINLVVNIEGLPKIKAPPYNMVTVLGLTYWKWYWLYATNHPTSFRITAGVLPAGLRLDADGTDPENTIGAPGAILGTPTAEESPHVVTFVATNATGDSIPYNVQFSVIAYLTPTVTSEASMTVYMEEQATYQITTDLNSQMWRAGGLPNGLKLVGSVITGTADDTLGDYKVGIQALNRFGWGTVFTLTITVAIAPPVISSPGEMTCYVNQQFDYDIMASHTPLSFGAVDLPIGLFCNPETGKISGIPVAVDDPEITMQAINQGGMGSKLLILHVITPPPPVIDTSATHGRVLTADTHSHFNFKPSASPAATSWSVDSLPQGLNLLPDGSLDGVFLIGGLISVTFTATNDGGDSDPATFWFLVTLSESTAVQINQMGTICEIWINMTTAAVTIGSGLTQDVDLTGKPSPPKATDMTIKRGDTTEVQVIFHDDGIPSDINLRSLKFGMKPSYDEEFVVFCEGYTIVTGSAGRYRIAPDFSGTNDDLDAILVQPTTTLLGEIQWEMQDANGNNIRRSSQIFSIKILRDLIHPD